jgi:hypothetical protein
MWLTQTYLAEPGTDFPAYAYLLFNPYSDWHGEVIRSIRNGLRILGRQTPGKLAISMPDDKVDQHQIGEQLTTHFAPLVNGLDRGQGIRCGVFIVNIPLNRLEPDGSNARWVYYGFDEFIEAGGLKPGFERLMTALAQCANLSEEDTISRFVWTFEGTRTKINRAKLADAISLSMSLSGFPSIGVSIGKLVGLFKNDNSVITNIYR